MQRLGVATQSGAHEIVCDRCGRATARGEPEFDEMTSIALRAGYGSIFGDRGYA